MKGIVVDVKTGIAKVVDDGLPEPAYQPEPELIGIDLQVVKAKLLEIDDLKTRVIKLEAK